MICSSLGMHLKLSEDGGDVRLIGQIGEDLQLKNTKGKRLTQFIKLTQTILNGPIIMKYHCCKDLF